MGLTSSLLIGRSALTASQLALQVTGNNIANVGTPGYHRQVVSFSATPGERVNDRTFVGRGVSIADIRRAVDPALQTRLRSSLSDEAASQVASSVLSQLESLMGELTGNDLSSELSAFFNAFSELANNPSASINRSAVVEQGASLASFVKRLRTDLAQQRDQVDREIRVGVERANTLLTEIASLNLSVVRAELGSGTDGNLRDQRDALINELSGLMDITAVERESGAVDILVGSTPVVLGTASRGLETLTETVNGDVDLRVLVTESQETVKIDGGRIGGLLAQRDGAIQKTIDELDTLGANLIFEVNRLHSSGRPQKRITEAFGTLKIGVADQTLALNDPANAALADLRFGPKTGSFKVVITDQNGNRSEQVVEIDLDGIDALGAASTADDTTAADIVAALDAVPNLHAEFTPDGRVRVYTDAGFDVSFADDSSGALAVLGINTFFEGKDATDIGVRSELRTDPLGLTLGLNDGTNETALAIAALRDAPVDSLDGDSLSQRWLKTVERTAVQSRAANTQADAATTVRLSLEAQEAAVSGVSLDEEAINLINYQQQYSGAARFISVVNELTDVLLNLV